MKARRKHVFVATFDAEQYWRDSQLAKLPFFPDGDAERIVSAMDEMMFLFSQPGDVILTRKAFQPAYLNYLRSIGFDFESNPFDLDVRNEKQKSMFELLLESDYHSQLTEMIGNNAVLAPFAVLPRGDQVCESYKLQGRLPSFAIVQRVNSKLYSHHMKDRLQIRNVGQVIQSGGDLLETGEKLLQEGSFLIKDLFGVSGKGNLLITSKSMLERIAAYLTSQENKGKAVQFIVEPLLSKSEDFSCQFHLNDEGKLDMIAVNKLINVDFAYTESCTPDQSFLANLEEKGYFKMMENIGRELFKDGYIGHVCVDSMILEDGEVIPLIEINARKSMSLIKNQVDKHLKQRGLSGNLSYLSVSNENASFGFEHLLDSLDKEGLLYTASNGKGVFPLSANTLDVNQHLKKAAKGRLYYSIVSKDVHEKQQLNEQLRSCFTRHAYKLFN
ncbi:hypothetical protein [Paenibacillus sinopodophylli]|uniref:hypothetical protein n=1 Tax=Paenibacillus sinopodophylli TaxID=1837342 RepID=UPI00110CBCA7|nr:hypothetical protein [Paenibacillus sinopodophylli]